MLQKSEETSEGKIVWSDLTCDDPDDYEGLWTRADWRLGDFENGDEVLLLPPTKPPAECTMSEQDLITILKITEPPIRTRPQALIIVWVITRQITPHNFALAGFFRFLQHTAFKTQMLSSFLLSYALRNPRANIVL
jgi:hypothetical protein